MVSFDFFMEKISQFKQTQKTNEEEIKQGINDVMDELEDYRNRYIDEWIEDNYYEGDSEFTIEDYKQFKDDSLDLFMGDDWGFCSSDYGEDTIDYIKKQLGYEDVGRLQRRSEVGGLDFDDLVWKEYISKLDNIEEGV